MKIYFKTIFIYAVYIGSAYLATKLMKVEADVVYDILVCVVLLKTIEMEVKSKEE